jgi:hypothetical protein
MTGENKAFAQACAVCSPETGVNVMGGTLRQSERWLRPAAVSQYNLARYETHSRVLTSILVSFPGRRNSCSILLMEDFAKLMQRLLGIQSGGRQRSPELIAEDERLMDAPQGGPMNDLHTVLCQKEQDAERVRREIQALRKVIPLLADDQPSFDDVMDLSLASSRTIAEPSGNGMADLET